MNKFRFTIFLIAVLVIGGVQVKAQSKFSLRVANSQYESVAGVVQNDSGNFVMACRTYNSVAKFDVEMVEISPSGTLLQSRKITTGDNTFPHALCATGDGGYLVGGYVYTNSSNTDWMVMKFNSALDLTWYKRYSGTGNDYVNNCYELQPGRYLLTGTVAIGGSAKPSMILINDTGAVVKESYFNTNQFASPDFRGWYLGNGKVGFSHLTNAVCVIDTNGNVVTNSSMTYGAFSNCFAQYGNKYAVLSTGDYGAPNGSTAELTTMDTALSVVRFDKKFKYSGYNMEPLQVLKKSSGNYIVASNASSFSTGYYHPVVMEVDTNGLIVWSRDYNVTGSLNTQIYQILPATDGGFLIVGEVLFGSNSSLFVSKMDSLGAIGCNDAAVTLITTAGSASAVTPHTQVSGTIGMVPVAATTLSVPTLSVNAYCMTTAVEEVHSEAMYEIRPLTMNGRFEVVLNGSAPVQLSVIDMNGKTILNRKVTETAQVQLQEFSTGMYLVMLQEKNGSVVLSKKILYIH
jgi:hypothetical protein